MSHIAVVFAVPYSTYFHIRSRLFLAWVSAHKSAQVFNGVRSQWQMSLLTSLLGHVERVLDVCSIHLPLRELSYIQLVKNTDVLGAGSTGFLQI